VSEPPTAEYAEPDLDYWSFIDVAMDRTLRALPQVDARAMRLVLSLYRASNALVYDLESAVHRPRGWSWAGFRVLFVLWLVGPLEAKRAAQLSGMSRAAVSALVNTLERDGLVTRRRGAGPDRRAVELSLTATGTEAVASAFAAHNERERTWASALSDAEVDQLTALLEKLMASPVAAAANRRR
jgi:DNA-binding MarR family transcriptional regulator